MNWSHVVRGGHRFLSIIFTLMVAAIFAAIGVGQEPAPWIYFLPLAPLALLMISGLYMFFLPYAAKVRGRQHDAV